MPLFKINNKLYKVKVPEIVSREGVPYLKFIPAKEDVEEFTSKFGTYDGVYGLVPVICEYVLGWNIPPADNLKLQQIDVEPGFAHVDFKNLMGRRLLVGAPQVKELFVVDYSSYPAEWLQDLVEFSIGIQHGKKETIYLDLFFKETNFEKINPFRNKVAYIHDHRIRSAILFEHPEYFHNGKFKHHRIIDVKSDQAKEYVWPSYFSIAFLFSESMPKHLLLILKERIMRFHAKHKIAPMTGFRLIDEDAIAVLTNI